MLQVFGLIRSRLRSPCFPIRVLGTSFAPASRRALREMLHAPVVAGYATTCNGGKSTGTGPPSRASEQSLEESYRRCFVGDHLSTQYKEARPTIPPGMVAEIVEYADKTIRCQDGLCVDVGCGPGQSTDRFSPYFKAVLGTDISETQIDIARATCTASNVTFEVSKAESLPVEDGSVALVSTVNALHWFHKDAFFAEVRRVLADGGVFCPALYRLRAVAEPGLEDCLEEFRTDEFKGYTTPQHDFWTYGYDYTEVPFDDAQKRDFVVKEKTTLSALMSLVETWSFVIRKKEKEPEEAAKALERLSSRIRSKLGKSAEDDSTLHVAYKASYILCRK